MQKTGYKEVHKIAKKAGITSKLPPDLSLALGSADVSLLEMTGAYMPFAGDGSFRKPSFISKIVLADGSIIYPENDRSRQAVAAKSGYMKRRVAMHKTLKRHCAGTTGQDN